MARESKHGDVRYYHASPMGTLSFAHVIHKIISGGIVVLLGTWHSKVSGTRRRAACCEVYGSGRTQEFGEALLEVAGN